MNNSLLSKEDSEKDIGVNIQKSLKPSLQCKKAAEKASFVLGQISRAFFYKDKSVYKPV